MKNKSGLSGRLNATGFTLIELLVVVLIIGILAAVALPQYQKAVIKSRLTQDLVRVRALHDGGEIYYLANGSYPNDVRDIDLDITSGAEINNSENFTSASVPAAFYSDGTECIIIRDYYAACGKIPENYYLEYTWDHPVHPEYDGGAGRQSCCGKKDTQMDAVCRSMAKKTTRDWQNQGLNFNCYVLN